MKELHRPHAVPADLLEKAVGVGSRGTGPLGNPPADVGTVGQQVVEDCGDGGADIWCGAQWEGQGDGEGVLPFQPRLSIRKPNGPVILLGELADKSAVDVHV